MAVPGLFSRHCLPPPPNPQLLGWCQGAGKRPGASLGSVSVSGEARIAGLYPSQAGPGLRACHPHTLLWASALRTDSWAFLLPPGPATAFVMAVGGGLARGPAVGTGAGMTGQPGLLWVRVTGVPLPALPCFPTDLKRPDSSRGKLDSCPPRESPRCPSAWGGAGAGTGRAWG